MRLPPLKKLLREDLPGAPDWVSPMINVINSFFEASYQLFNKNIAYDQNIACQIKEISYSTPSTYPAIDDIQFVSGLKIKATGCIVLAAFDSETYTPAVGPVYAPWQDVNGNIVIGPITGLVASKNFTIRLLIT